MGVGGTGTHDEARSVTMPDGDNSSPSIPTGTEAPNSK